VLGKYYPSFHSFDCLHEIIRCDAGIRRRPLGKGMKMAGRAVTVRFVPQRPDIGADKPAGVNSPEYEAFEKCGPKEVPTPHGNRLLLSCAGHCLQRICTPCFSSHAPTLLRPLTTALDAASCVGVRERESTSGVGWGGRCW
jgi:hypothetical protein